MTLADATKGQIENGWKCIKPNSGKGWATFKIDNSADWTEEQRREWNRKRIEIRLQQATEEDLRRRRSLSPLERDKLYRAILASLELSAEDREDLERRGFTPEEIDLGEFKSIKKHQRLATATNPLLPGASIDGKYFYSSVDGYLCPVRDINGLIVAFQVRARNEQEGGRYRWISTSSQTLHLYPEGATEGELPLAVFRANQEPAASFQKNALPAIWLVEGTGPKPFAISQRLDVAVIGASGGQFTASKKLTENYLNKLLLHYQITEKVLAIPPDAGDALNPSVMHRWASVFELLTQIGWTVKVVWWGQISKEKHQDIDELESFDCLEYISTEEFLELASLAQKQAKTEEQERQERLKAEAEEAVYQSLTTIQENPWKEVTERYLNIAELIEPGAIYIVSSAKETGKTQQLIEIIPNYGACFAWFPRVALGRSLCSRVGLNWKDDLSTFSSNKKVGFCADSAHQFNPQTLAKRGLLLCDEADQVFDHLFGDTCNKDGKRPMILASLEAHLEAAIAGGGAALFMSADISQKEIDYIKALAPVGCPVRVIVNHYKPEKCACYFDTSEKPNGTIERLLDMLESEIPCFVIDDIKNGVRGCKSIAEYVRSVHPEWAGLIVEIHSDSSGEAEVVEFLKNINKASENKLLICCSPSVVSGISIDNLRFVRGVFGFFNGILPVTQALQALSRVRKPENIFVWAAESGLIWEANRATDPREINSYYQRNYERNYQHILAFNPEYQPLKNEWSSPHWELYCKNGAYRNLCMNKLRERLRSKIKEEGYNIIECQNCGSDMIADGLKQSWGKIELSEALAVADARILSDQELERLSYKTTPLTPEEKVDFQKTLLHKWFGEELIAATNFTHKETGSELTSYAAMYLKNSGGHYKQQLDNFYLLVAPASESVERDLAGENRQIKHGFGRFPGDVKWRTRQRKAREFLGLDKFLEIDTWTTPNDYKELAAKARKYPHLVKDALGINPERIATDSQIFVELIEQLGLKLDSEWVEGGTSPQGKRIRYKKRRINILTWNHAQMYVAHRQPLKAEVQPEEQTETKQAEEQPNVEAAKQLEIESVQLTLELNRPKDENQDQTEPSQTVKLEVENIALLWAIACEEENLAFALEQVEGILQVTKAVVSYLRETVRQAIVRSLSPRQQARVRQLLAFRGRRQPL